MPPLDGPPGPFILLALSVALAAYNIIFLYNLFSVPQEKRTEKSKAIIELLKPQVTEATGVRSIFLA